MKKSSISENSLRASSSSFQDRSSFAAAPKEGRKALPDARPVLLRPERRNLTLYTLTVREREPTCILAWGFGSRALDRRQATTALPASSSPQARTAALPIRTDAKANPVQMGFELHARLVSRRAQLPKATAQPGALHGLEPTESPPAHPKTVPFPSLFVLICEQIPLGRVPGRAWVCAGRDLNPGGGVVIKMPLHAASS